MTLDEFLEFRNPQGKRHPSEAYDFDFAKMNEDWSISPVGRLNLNNHTVYDTPYVLVYQVRGTKNYLLRGDGKHYREGQLLGVLHNGTMYVDPRLPTHWIDWQGYNEFRRKNFDLPVRAVKKVKYIDEYLPLVSNVAQRHLEKYPYVLQRIKVGNEPMTVRLPEAPKHDKGQTIAILNAQGMIVAQATNEWGATLLSVAKEYRGRGLGKVLGKFWYDMNPSFTSGGFTSSGEANAIALWKDRVREFLSRGWYSELVRHKRMTQKQVKEILAELGERPKPRPQPKMDKDDDTAGQPLLMADEDGSYFYLYDQRFLDDPDPKYIHGFGFFRDSGDKEFIFRIDYDRKWHKWLTYIALQIARDQGVTLWNGEGYGDILELEGLPHVEQVGDYVKLTKDVMPVDQMARLERQIRRRKDRYDEKKVLLMEEAEMKW